MPFVTSMMPFVSEARSPNGARRCARCTHGSSGCGASPGIVATRYRSSSPPDSAAAIPPPRLHTQADSTRLAKAVRLKRERGDPLIEQSYLVSLRRHTPPNCPAPVRQGERADTVRVRPASPAITLPNRTGSSCPFPSWASRKTAGLPRETSPRWRCRLGTPQPCPPWSRCGRSSR